MKRCTRCVLPENYPRIGFSEAGVCNYCLTHRKWEYKEKEELDKFLEPFRNKGERYDCIVGISGGRDSSYALYYLVTDLLDEIGLGDIEKSRLSQRSIGEGAC